MNGKAKVFSAVIAGMFTVIMAFGGLLWAGLSDRVQALEELPLWFARMDERQAAIQRTVDEIRSAIKELKK